MHTLSNIVYLIDVLGKHRSGCGGTFICHSPATLWTRVRLCVTTSQIDCDHDFKFLWTHRVANDVAMILQMTENNDFYLVFDKNDFGIFSAIHTDTAIEGSDFNFND